ncbi:MAG TPA: high-potential iron-sulfur protein [Steroidobacteraceae bacterium]|nr:high-potential iron-sulfur protein [Steroidobacteraceae bacterium]
MRKPHSPARRRLLRGLALGVPLGSLALARAARAAAPPLPLLSVDAPEAKAVKYVEDAAQAGPAAAGTSCANCALYQGPDGSPQGPCQIFPGRDVKAKGWCTSWAPQM